MSPLNAVPGSTGRLAFLDQLRALLTLLVVFHHTAITYGGSGSWYYREVPGAAGDNLTATILTIFCAVNQAWFMGAFFLFAGYVTPPPFDRKGPRRFMLDRAMRLGIPLLVFGFFVDASTVAIADVARGGDFMQTLRLRVARLDYQPGPLWFVQTLLVFALAYAAWRLFRPATPLNAAPLPSHWTLLIAALVTGAAAFIIRLFVPVGREFAHMQLGYYASYVVLFAAGCMAWPHHWLERVDWPYARRWWITTLVALPLLPVAVLAHRAMSPSPIAVSGGFNPWALFYAYWEPFVAWGALLALVWYFRTGVSEDRFRGLARRAYAIYCFHPPVVVAISVALRTWAAPGAIKFLAVGTLSCVTLYVATGLLLRIRPIATVW